MLLFPHTSPLRVPEVLFWVNHILNISQNTDLFLTPSGFQSSIYFTASIWSTVACPSMNSVSVLGSCLRALWQTLSNLIVLEASMSHPQCCWPLNPRSSPSPTWVPHFIPSLQDSGVSGFVFHFFHGLQFQHKSQSPKAASKQKLALSLSQTHPTQFNCPSCQERG